MDFDPARDIPDLTGKIILVTGGNSGIGAATVKALALHHPAGIYLCCRLPSSAAATLDSVYEICPDARIELLQLDLSSFASIKNCVSEFTEKSSRLDLLFLNAGVSATAPSLTEEGYESQFGINHLGHALLTQLLMPTLFQTVRHSETSDVRVVVITSIAAHDMAPVQGLVLDQMTNADAFASTLQRYGHSKLANVLFAWKLSQVYPAITSISVHPGTVWTPLWSKANGGSWKMTILKPIVWLLGLSEEKGVVNGLWCATAKLGSDGVRSGKYYEPVGLQKERSKHALDQNLANELWEWTNNVLARHGSPGWSNA